LASATPSDSWLISAEEKAFLQQKVKAKKPAAETAKRNVGALQSGALGMPWAVAVHPGLWAVFGAHMAFNFGAYYLTNWSGTYYKDVLGVPPEEAYLHLMLPHITNLAAKAANPSIVALLASRGYTLLDSRRAFTCTGFILASLLLALVYPLRSSVWLSTVLFSLINAAFGLAPSGFKANYLDITEEYVGVISGYGNTLGTVASLGQPKLLAYILDSTGATPTSTASGSWLLVLATVGGVNVLAAANYARHATVVPIENLVVGEASKEL